MTMFKKCWGIHTGKGLARTFSSQTFSRMAIQLFSNLVIIHLLAYEDGTDRMFRNVSMYNSDMEELLRKKEYNRIM
jgi:hypothetical protein